MSSKKVKNKKQMTRKELQKHNVELLTINAELLDENKKLENSLQLLQDVHSVNEMLRGRITRQEELAALDRERIAQQANQIQDLRETLRALGHEA